MSFGEMTLYKHTRKTPKNGWGHKATSSWNNVRNAALLEPDRVTQRLKKAAMEKTTFGRQVETAYAMTTPDPWLLIVSNPPDRLVALLSRLGLKPSKTNTNYWIRFEVTEDARKHAKHIVHELKAAGLVPKQDFNWMQVNRQTKNRTR